MEQLKNYYLLCSLRKYKAHPISDDKELAALFTSETLSMYFKKTYGKYILNEDVVGGDDRAVDLSAHLLH